MDYLSKEYWNSRYVNDQTGWDTGAITRPIRQYVEQLTDTSLHILIPGCGNAHEAAFLLQQGFKNVTCIDISPLLCERLEDRLGKAGLNVICGDFFEHTDTYDLIIEQTFFCAIHPRLRQEYAKHMHRLLKPNGKLAGLMFDCLFDKEGPPYGGSAAEYRGYFASYFHFHVFEKCNNSIPQRAGNELFVVLRKRA
jgi:SAM-dependent methyltransferase